MLISIGKTHLQKGADSEPLYYDLFSFSAYLTLSDSIPQYAAARMTA
jgi:hypothetical protein